MKVSSFGYTICIISVIYICIYLVFSDRNDVILFVLKFDFNFVFSLSFVQRYEKPSFTYICIETLSISSIWLVLKWSCGTSCLGLHASGLKYIFHENTYRKIFMLIKKSGPELWIQREIFKSIWKFILSFTMWKIILNCFYTHKYPLPSLNKLINTLSMNDYVLTLQHLVCIVTSSFEFFFF